MSELLSQGGYGCVYHPALTCSGKAESSTRSVSKLQRKDWASKNEVEIGRMIKKMSGNKFYSLGLQRDIHILTAGLRADPSVEGQLGFHLDFLRVSQDLNNRFRKQLADQFKEISKIK